MGTTLDKPRMSRALRAILCALLALATAIPATALSAAQSARAYASGTANLEVGDKVGYAGYSTTHLSVDGVVVYCATPSKKTPSAGTYSKETLAPADASRLNSMYSILYYGWDGPGFDASMWPSTWYDGTAMTADRYLALTHIIISDIYASDGYAALYGTAEAFQYWCWTEILGANWSTGSYTGENYDSVQYKIYANESKVPQSFKDSCYQLNSGSSTHQTLVGYEPLGWIELQKSSSNAAISEGNALYSLAGAVYGIYSDSSCTNLVDTMTTDASGYAKSSALSAGAYYVKETAASSGYALDVSAHAVSATTGSTARVESEEMPQNNPADLWVGKIDSEDTLNTPLGAASLAGAEFTVRYYDGHYASAEEAEASGNPDRTWVVATDDEGCAKLLESYKVSGDAFYCNSDGAPTMPLGTIVIQETKAPEGYVLDSTVHVRQVTGEGTGESVWTYQAPTQPEQVKRGDLEFTKASETSQNRMANVAFKITSRTTGESHIAVTDANGHFSTSSDYAAHSRDTNGNDDALNEDGSIDDSKLNVECGIWFGQYDDADGNVCITEADDGLGALPYDVYDIEELACAANEGLQLVCATATVTRNGYTVDLGTIDDPEASIATRATDKADGDQNVAVDDRVAVVDRVTYSNLIPNRTYVLSARLVEKETGEAVATAEQAFTPENASGYVNMELVADTIELAGRQLVVYETLSLDGRVIASHEDADDAEQTVTVVPPEIGTTATDGVDGDHKVVADPEAKVVDVVSYAGLVPDKEYVIEGVLMAKSTDEAGDVVGEELLDIDGNPIAASASFTPEKSSGTVEVTFEFDASVLPNETKLVAFEALRRNGVEIATHADISDEGQTVEVETPEIGTIATDGLDGDKEVAADPEATLTDTVSYTGLLEGAEYLLCGELMKRVLDDEGNVSAEPVLDEEGNPLVVEKTFTPEESSGTTEMEFAFDASEFADGDKLVVYETLYRNDSVICEHRNAEDEGQTVTVLHPTMGTTAIDGADGDKEVAAGQKAVVVDTVEYEGVVPGKEYVVTGTLMTKSTDAEGDAVGEELPDADGNPVTASATFVPEEANGAIEVTFEFDASLLAGKELVAFESLSRNGVEVAAHADIHDEGQTVTVREEDQPLGDVFDKTGNFLRQHWWIPVLVAAAAIGLAAWGLRQSRLAKTGCNWTGGSASDWRNE